MQKAFVYIFFLFILLFNSCDAKHLYLEKDYQNIWCTKNKGITEFRLPDCTRIDCLTKTHAIEFDFAEKWAESIGQALYYSYMTNKKPGIVLIIENPQKEEIYLKRLKTVCCPLGIDVWIMYNKDIY